MEPSPARTTWLALVAAALVLGGCAGIAVAGIVARPPDRLLIGVSLGTTFGQATLAAFWVALGTGALWRRLLLSLLWMLAVAIPWLAHRTGDAALLWASILGQFVLTQGPLWALRVVRGVRIRPAGESKPAGPGAHQFGIGQLMILTALVAVLLGAGRAVAPYAQRLVTGYPWREAPAFAFVVVTNIVLTLPLALAALLPRYAPAACAVGLAFVALATVVEFSLLGLFIPGNPQEVEVLVMLWIMNGCQSAWVIGGLSLLRAGGYRLA